jgi:ubiquinone/menaquinone biosynthesis C-methylase UbiE
MPVGTDNESSRITWIEKTLARIPEGSRILDAGAGERPYKKYCHHLNYVAQDFGCYNGMGNGEGLQEGTWDQTGLDIICDITNIPEPNESFDTVLCTEVFEHLPNPLAALKEFYRLLKPDGYLVLTAPFCCLTHFAPFYYYTGFSHYFYDTHLQANGFLILEIEQNGNFFEYIAQEIHRIKKVAKKYTDQKPNLYERFLIWSILKMLDRFSKKDKGSHELLCFGYHVLAQKKE